MLPIGTKIPLFQKPEGNATEQTVMEGITFSSQKGIGLKGKIKNRGKLNFPCSENDQVNNNDGYYSQINVKGLNSMTETEIEKIIKNTIENNGSIRKTLAENIITNMNDLGVKNFKTWSWIGNKTSDNYISNLKVPFKIKILLIKFRGHKGHHEGTIYQSWIDNDILNTTIGNHFLFLPKDTVRENSYIEPQNFNILNKDGYDWSEFKLNEDKQTIEFYNSNLFSIEIYALG